MNCPNWQNLVGEGGDRESDIWLSALGHLDHCSECRPGALAADPLLAFRRLPSAELDEAEVEDLRARVRMARRVQQATRSSRRSSRWREAVAAAVLLVAAGWAGGGHESLELSGTIAGSGAMTELSFPSVSRTYPSAFPVQGASIQESAIWNNLDGAAMPLFEEIGEPYQQVVQWSDESLSVVLVVDERFDV